MGLQYTGNFEQLLKEYTPHKLIEDKQKKTNYFWNKLPKDKEWVDGQPYQIPWELSEASAFEIGGLIDTAKITDALYKKGTINEHAFLSGAMKYHSRDLKKHGDMKKSFLKILPKKATKFAERMKYLTNIMLLDKGTISKTVGATGHDLPNGIIKVNKAQRHMRNERVVLHDTASSTPAADLEAYIGKIVLGDKRTVEIVDAAGAAIDLDAAGFTAANSIEIKIVGYDRDQFFTFVDHLLPAAQGGSDLVNGLADVKKEDAPVLQPHVFNASSWTKSTIHSDLYDFYFDIKELGKVDETEILCGFGLYKAVAIGAEEDKRYTTTKKRGIGFSSIVIDGPMGEMTLTALEEMPDDKIYVIDWESFVFAGDEFFKPMRDMNGNLYHTQRVAGSGNGSDGYIATQDIALSGQFLMIRPSGNACAYGINLS